LNAYDTIQELQRVSRLPVIDDAQLELIVSELYSYDSYTVQEDGGYGSTYSNSYEVSVRDSAESALKSAGAKVLTRLAKRLRLTDPSVQPALLRVLAAAEAKSWATLSAQERTEARHLLELAVGSAEPLFGTLALADDQVKAPAARARDLIALRLLAIEAGEKATEPVVQALLGPSTDSRKAAIESASFLGGSPALTAKLIDAVLDPLTKNRSDVSWAISAAQLRLDATQRARLADVVDDRQLGWYARTLLGPYLRDPNAEAELPLVERVVPSIARAIATDTNEGAWHSALKDCGAVNLGRALVPVLRENLANGKVSSTLLHHMALVGTSLAPIAPELLRYLDPKTSPDGRHVHEALWVARTIESVTTVPALIPLLKTTHQVRALHALAAMGPRAAAAIPAVEQFSFEDGGVSRDVVWKLQAETLAKLRGK
jgi:hypothetical protein